VSQQSFDNVLGGFSDAQFAVWANGVVAQGGPATITYTVPRGFCLVAQYFDAVFSGAGGGGALYLEDPGAGINFWATVPAGGSVQWDHWAGFQVFAPLGELVVHCSIGDFNVRGSGLLVPAANLGF
jgi:hypothetical protein